MQIPESPIIFSKFATCIVGPDDPVVLPRGSEKTDYEAELAFVVGRLAKDVPRDKALGHVFGYCCFNDVSERGFQFADGQWQRGKSCDTFAPMGPYVVTADEITNPHNLGIKLRLNGETMQNSRTEQLIFGIPQLIEFLSRSITLEPGDVIATGHAAGRRVRPQAAGVHQAGRQDGGRDRRPGRAEQPRGGGASRAAIVVSDPIKIKLNRTSARLTEDIGQPGARAQLYAAGLSREDLGKPQVGIASTGFDSNPCNMHLDAPGRPGEGRRAGGGDDRLALQHHRRQRRRDQRHHRDELLAALPGSDRRLDRGHDHGPLLRRQRLGGRLRQEHAGRADGDGPHRPAQHHGLRRHHPAGPAGRTQAGHHLGLRGLRAVPGQADQPGADGGGGRARLPGRRRLRRHVHRQHHGLGHRDHGHDPAHELVHPGGAPGQAGRVRGARGGRC